MKKEISYLLNFLIISIVVFVIGYISTTYLIKVSTNNFLELQTETSKQQAKEFSTFISYQIDADQERDLLINNIQKSIEGSNTENSFISMFDWSGVEVCHPNPDRIGKKVNPQESYVKSLESGISSEDFYELLKEKKEAGGIRKFDTDIDSEIIYLYPVKNSDWIIAAHANMENIKKVANKIKSNFLIVYVLTSVAIILLCLLTVRYIGNYYHKALEAKNEKLTEEVLNLSKLNTNLATYKSKVLESKIDESNDKNQSDSKIIKRVLTHFKDQILSIKVDDIAYINTENSITYLVCLDGKKYTSNSSLDELYNKLDDSLFFRANRQYILSIKGINEILKYGNSQLKITTYNGDSVIVSKNKASEFKKWLEK